MICDFDSELNDGQHICNSRTGNWVQRDSVEGRMLEQDIDTEQPDIINTVINGRARILRRVGHNNYVLITNYQPRKIYDIPEDKINKRYCGNNSNIFDMTNYVNYLNGENPYRYIDIDNLYNCLKKGIYVGKEMDEEDIDI